jgi:hypothetical protein
MVRYSYNQQISPPAPFVHVAPTAAGVFMSNSISISLAPVQPILIGITAACLRADFNTT